MKSDAQVQRNFRTHYGKEPPSRPTIWALHTPLMETGNVRHKQGASCPSVSDANVGKVQQVFARSPTTSVRTAARELGMPQSTVHKVWHKRLRHYAYKVQLLQALKPTDKPQHKQLAVDMLAKIYANNYFLEKICFSNESTFHVCGKLNGHNVHIWEPEHPHVTREIERQSQGECVVQNYTQLHQ